MGELISAEAASVIAQFLANSQSRFLQLGAAYIKQLERRCAGLEVRCQQLEAEVARLKEIAAGADDGGHWYSHQTMQAVVAEREALRTRCQQLEAQLALGHYPADYGEYDPAVALEL